MPDNVAGKKIRCPKCKEVIQVPAGEAAATEAAAPTPKPTPSAAQSASQQKPATPKTAPTAPTAAKPAKPALESWYLKTEDGESYGPVPRAELDAWYAEGRVTIDCQLLREGSDQWQWASELYPELDPASAAKVVPTTPEVAEAPGEKPAPAAKTAAPAPAAAKPTTPAKEIAATKPTAPAKLQPAPTATPTPAKEETASPMSFFPSEEPAETEPAASEDNPFAFLGGGGGNAGGGDAFNFSAAPSAGGSTAPKAKTTKKAAVATASSSASSTDSDEVSSKSKLTAGLLAIFLGSLGVHRFYLGYTVLGIVQLLLCGGCGIWQLIDVIMIFTGKLPDAQGKLLKG